MYLNPLLQSGLQGDGQWCSRLLPGLHGGGLGVYFTLGCRNCMSPGSTTPRALLRHASVQQVLDAAGDGVVVVQVGGLVAGAGGLAAV